MKPIVKVSRDEQIPRDEYITLYNKLQELRKVSTKENCELVQPIVEKIRNKLFNDRVILTYQGKKIGTTRNVTTLTLKKKMKYLKDYIEEIRSERQSKRELDSREVNIQGYSYKTIGGLRVTPLSSLKRKHHPRFAREYKRPVVASNCIGIEIEMTSDITLDQMAMLIAVNKLDHKVRVMTDGSIRCEDSATPHAFEINILDTEYNINNTLDKFEKMLSSADFTFKTNLSCGTHIHFDMRQRDIDSAYTNLFEHLDEITKTVHSSRLENKFCKRNIESDYHGALESYSGAASRYQMINPAAYHKHGTLEVRVFEGTLDFSKIKGWISMCLNIIDNNKVKAVANV